VRGRQQGAAGAPADSNLDVFLYGDICRVNDRLRVFYAAAREFSTMPIFTAGVFYLVMNWAVSFAFARAEKRLSYYTH
jgi:hypothetical protein